MNLNVITQDDAEKLADAVKTTDTPAPTIANPNTSNGPQVTADDLYARLLKYIPAPLLGIYLFLVNAVVKINDHSLRQVAVIAWYVVMAVLVVVYLRTRKVKRNSQIGVALLAFTGYAFASSGPDKAFGWYDPLMGSAALAIVAAVLVATNPSDLSPDVINDLKP